MALVTASKITENSIVKAKPLSTAEIEIPKIQTVENINSRPWNDLSWTPRSHLLTHIEGSTWTVHYYCQVLTNDSQLSGQQYTVNPVYQQYKLIKNLELKVSSPLQSTQDSTTKTMTLTGTSIVYPFLIPNEGDLFIADIGENQNAVFRVTDSIKKSIFKEACYEISYGLNTTDNYTIADLNQKVIDTLYYHKDFLTYGQNPIIIKNDHDTLIELNKVYQHLCQQYFKKFFSNEFKTLILPGQPFSIYDRFLIDYILSTFTTEDSQEIRFIRKYGVGDDDVFKTDSLWNVIKYRDVSVLNTCFKTFGIVGANTFSNDPILEGFRYSGIRKIIYPADPVLNIDYIQSSRVKILDEEWITPSNITVPGIMVRAINLKDTNIVETVHPVTIDKYYVLSKNFYDKTLEMSTLEYTLWQYLTNEDYDKDQLVNTAKKFYEWGVLEQFYYIPILLTLIKAAIRGI